MSDLFANNVIGPWGQEAVRANLTSALSGQIGDSSKFAGDIDLRKEIGDFMDLRGHKVLMRKITNIRCPNWSPMRQEEHSKTCDYCMGNGYMYQDFIVKAFNRPSAVMEAQLGEQRQDIGMMGHNVQIYYMETTAENYDTKITEQFVPTVADYIVEMKLDFNTQEPIRAYRFNAIFNIQIIHAARDRNGRVEYFICKCTERPTGA